MTPIPAKWRTLAVIGLSIVVVIVTQGIKYAWLGFILALCVCFPIEGAIGSIIGFDLVALATHGTFDFILLNTFLLVVTIGALAVLMHRWGIDAAESQNKVGLINLFQVLVLAVLARFICWLAINFAQQPFTATLVEYALWNSLKFYTVAVIVALLLIRFVTPVLPPLGLRRPG